jgi:protein TonB
MRGENRTPALIGSVALHALVLGAGLITLPLWSKPIQLANSVPVTIVSHAPPEAPSAAVQAPEPTPETIPEPAPVSQPASPRPAPPQPAPPKVVPVPAPAPTPKKVEAKPAPVPAPALKKVEAKPVDLGALAASLPQAKPSKAKPAAKPFDLAALTATLPKSAGAKGPPHSAAGPVANPGPVRPLTGDEMGAVTSKLMRLWHPNCGAEGVGKVLVRVEIHLTPDGRLARPPELLDRPLVDAGGPIAQVSAQRALSAVVQGEPYSELPRDRYPAWKDIIARFSAKEACSGT